MSGLGSYILTDSRHTRRV